MATILGVMTNNSNWPWSADNSPFSEGSGGYITLKASLFNIQIAGQLQTNTIKMRIGWGDTYQAWKTI